MKRALKPAFFILGATFLVWFALPIGVGILNIGNLTGMGLALVVMLISLFYRNCCSFLRFLWRFFAGKAAIFLIGGFAALCITAGLIITAGMLFAAANSPPQASTNAVVVVLGCRVRGTELSQMLKRRLDAAYAFLEENPSASCVVSGGQGAGEDVTEAAAMHDYLLSCGISAERILLEDKSTNTEENIRFSKAVMEENGIDTAAATVIIATDGFHQLRAATWSKAEGLKPYAISAFTRLDLLPTYYMRELFGMVDLYILK